MLTRTKLKAGEGELEPFNPETGRETQRKKMAYDDACSEHDEASHKAFQQMLDKVDQLFVDYHERLENKENKKV